jgi:hypothetical protein
MRYAPTNRASSCRLNCRKRTGEAIMEGGAAKRHGHFKGWMPMLALESLQSSIGRPS